MNYVVTTRTRRAAGRRRCGSKQWCVYIYRGPSQEWWPLPVVDELIRVKHAENDRPGGGGVGTMHCSEDLRLWTTAGLSWKVKTTRAPTVYLYAVRKDMRESLHGKSCRTHPISNKKPSQEYVQQQQQLSCLLLLLLYQVVVIWCPVLL